MYHLVPLRSLCSKHSIIQRQIKCLRTWSHNISICHPTSLDFTKYFSSEQTSGTLQPRLFSPRWFDWQHANQLTLCWTVVFFHTGDVRPPLRSVRRVQTGLRRRSRLFAVNHLDSVPQIILFFLPSWKKRSDNWICSLLHLENNHISRPALQRRWQLSCMSLFSSPIACNIAHFCQLTVFSHCALRAIKAALGELCEITKKTIVSL